MKIHAYHQIIQLLASMGSLGGQGGIQVWISIDDIRMLRTYARFYKRTGSDDTMAILLTRLSHEFSRRASVKEAETIDNHVLVSIPTDIYQLLFALGGCQTRRGFFTIPMLDEQGRPVCKFLRGHIQRLTGNLQSTLAQKRVDANREKLNMIRQHRNMFGNQEYRILEAKLKSKIESYKNLQKAGAHSMKTAQNILDDHTRKWQSRAHSIRNVGGYTFDPKRIRAPTLPGSRASLKARKEAYDRRKKYEETQRLLSRFRKQRQYTDFNQYVAALKENNVTKPNKSSAVVSVSPFVNHSPQVARSLKSRRQRALFLDNPKHKTGPLAPTARFGDTGLIAQPKRFVDDTESMYSAREESDGDLEE